MTREEAITELNTFKIGAKSELGENALDMAIKALEQEPCGKDINVSTTDAISREAVDTLVDELARAISDERCGIPRGRSTATIMQDILDLPPVNPQPKPGHWIHHPEIRFICTEHWECSVCHKSTMTNPVYKVNDYNNMYFCPKCGTKMTESEE